MAVVDASGRKRTGRRETEREQRLLRQGSGAVGSSGAGGASSSTSSSYEDGLSSSGPDDYSAASRSSDGRVEDDDGGEAEEDEELSCKRAWKLRSWQAAAGVTDDKGGTLTRLLPYDLDPDRIWEVMTALDLVDKVGGWVGGGKSVMERGGLRTGSKANQSGDADILAKGGNCTWEIEVTACHPLM